MKRVAQEFPILDIIGDIYDAAADPTKWGEVFTKLPAVMSAQHAGLAVNNPIDGKLKQLCVTPASLSFMDEYLNVWCAYDPWRIYGIHSTAGEIIRSEELVPESKFKSTQYYTEWYKHTDWDHMVGGYFLRSKTLEGYFFVDRSHRMGPFTQEDKVNMARLVPHLQRAVFLNEKIYLLTVEKEVTKGSSEDIGVVFLDEHGAVRYINHTMERLLTISNGLKIAANQLIAMDHKINGYLRGIIAATARTSASKAEYPGGHLQVPRTGGLKPLTLLISPYRGTLEQQALIGSPIRMVVLVSDPERKPPDLTSVLMQWYGLTRGEAEIAQGLLDYGSLEEIAGRRYVSKEAVRYHLKNVFAKVGVKRQAELIRVLLQGPVSLFKSRSIK